MIEAAKKYDVHWRMAMPRRYWMGIYMDRILRWLLRHNKLTIILFLAATTVSLALLPLMSVNYNVIDYLPDQAPSTNALSVMDDEFKEAVPNIRVMVKDVSIVDALEYKEKLKALDSIDTVLWLDDVVDVATPLDMADQKIVETYYKDGSALFSAAIAKGKEMRAVDEIYALTGEKGAIAGDAAGKAAYQKLSRSETARAMVLLVPIILIILLLTTTAWFEPVLFLGSIGISVLLNMGTNVIFGQISFITNAISPLLQLAVSLDYAIFLLHNFEKYRGECADIETAMFMAVKRSMVVIFASSMTTLFGFLALVVMQFKIGPDLGLALSKGILFSLISVMLFLPAITLYFYKWLEKSRHRSFMPTFKRASLLVLRVRAPVFALVLLLVVPAYLAQRNNAFTYGTGKLDPNTQAGQDEKRINDVFGESMPLLVLVPRGDIVKEAELGEELLDLPHVTSAVSYAKMVGAQIPAAFLDPSVVDQFYSEHYARIILYTNTPSEGPTAFQTVESVRAIISEYYGEDALAVGAPANLYDMRAVVTRDNQLVSILALLAISAIILLSFRSISLPIILVLAIQTAIWINLSYPYFAGDELNYIGFLVINTVQLGATVDYAILYSDHYMDNRKRMAKKEAALLSAQETMGSIMVSAAILSMAGFMLSMISTNGIVSELGSLLGRGTILSMAMALLFLPAALIAMDGIIKRTTLRAKFFVSPKGATEEPAQSKHPGGTT